MPRRAQDVGGRDQPAQVAPPVGRGEIKHQRFLAPVVGVEVQRPFGVRVVAGERAERPGGNALRGLDPDDLRAQAGKRQAAVPPWMSPISITRTPERLPGNVPPQQLRVREDDPVDSDAFQAPRERDQVADRAARGHPDADLHDFALPSLAPGRCPSWFVTDRTSQRAGAVRCEPFEGCVDLIGAQVHTCLSVR